MQQQILIDNYLGYIQTYERTQVIAELDYLVEIIAIDKLKNLTQKQLKFAEKTLSKLKINVGALKVKGAAVGRRLKADFDKGKTPEQVSAQLTKQIAKDIKNSLKRSKEAIYKLSLGKKIAISIVALLIVFYVNTMLATLLTLVISNPATVGKVVAIVIAPMVEEAAKNYFIQQGMPWTGTAIVFGIEAIQYILTLIFVGGAKLTKTILLRLTSLLMHFSSTFVQKKIIESGEDREFIAWTVGVGIHASWNALALFLDAKIIAWLTGG